MTSPSGLRDRKKAATRAALAEAAADLAREHGLHDVTADAIAARAGVSTRTFHNYFGSKEEAVLVYLESLLEVWIDLLRRRPADEPIMTSLEECSVGFATDPRWSFHEIVACVNVLEDSGFQSVHSLEVERRSARLLIEVIAERTGTDPTRELFPNLVLYASAGAVRAAIELSLVNRDEPLEDLVRSAFAQLRDGFR